VTRRDGYLLGRGVLDDKGPLVLSLYAAHYFVRLAREGADPMPYTLRCIVGANEETGMRDVDHYVEHFPQPAFCFTPDACFPLICGEKGHFTARVTSGDLDVRATTIVDFNAGLATNAIPGEATAVVAVPADALVASSGLELSDAGTDEWGRPRTRIHATGRGGHAAMPAGTVNAIGLIADCLLDSGIDLGVAEPFVRFQRMLVEDSSGGSLGIATSDDKFGPLTVIGGTVSCEREGDRLRLTQSLDSRYPTSLAGDELYAQVNARAEALGLTVVEHFGADPFYIEPSSPVIRACVESYQEVFDSDLEPITIGGGTYARHFSNAAAFGPLDTRVKDPEWAGPEHGADEAVSEAVMKKALVTYILAIARIMKLEL
jgi:succinyl-diaminopimelate desuccinylase